MEEIVSSISFLLLFIRKAGNKTIILDHWAFRSLSLDGCAPTVFPLGETIFGCRPINGIFHE